MIINIIEVPFAKLQHDCIRSAACNGQTSVSVLQSCLRLLVHGQLPPPIAAPPCRTSCWLCSSCPTAAPVILKGGGTSPAHSLVLGVNVKGECLISLPETTTSTRTSVTLVRSVSSGHLSHVAHSHPPMAVTEGQVDSDMYCSDSACPLAAICPIAGLEPRTSSPMMLNPCPSAARCSAQPPRTGPICQRFISSLLFKT